MNDLLQYSAPTGVPVSFVNHLFDRNGFGEGLSLDKSRRFITFEPTIYGYINHIKLAKRTQVFVCCDNILYLLEISYKTRRVKPSCNAWLTINGWEDIHPEGQPKKLTQDEIESILNKLER
jgi:hypothetical protein